MAAPVLNPKITKAGLALAPNPPATSFTIVLTHIAIGTGLYSPTGDEVALRQEVARYAISSGTNPRFVYERIHCNKNSEPLFKQVSKTHSPAPTMPLAYMRLCVSANDSRRLSLRSISGNARRSTPLRACSEPSRFAAALAGA